MTRQILNEVIGTHCHTNQRRIDVNLGVPSEHVDQFGFFLLQELLCTFSEGHDRLFVFSNWCNPRIECLDGLKLSNIIIDSIVQQFLLLLMLNIRSCIETCTLMGSFNLLKSLAVSYDQTYCFHDLALVLEIFCQLAELQYLREHNINCTILLLCFTPQTFNLYA